MAPSRITVFYNGIGSSSSGASSGLQTPLPSTPPARAPILPWSATRGTGVVSCWVRSYGLKFWHPPDLLCFTVTVDTTPALASNQSLVTSIVAVLLFCFCPQLIRWLVFSGGIGLEAWGSRLGDYTNVCFCVVIANLQVLYECRSTKPGYFLTISALRLESPPFPFDALRWLRFHDGMKRYGTMRLIRICRPTQ